MATGIRINYIRIPAVCFWMHIVLVSIRFYAKVQKCAEHVFSEYSSLDKLYNKTILPILNGEVSLPDVGYTTAKNYDDEGNLTGETAEAEPTPYQKTANCKKYEAELGWYGLMSPSGKVITPPRYSDIIAIGYDLYY
ncbi:hypothetical protein [Segatella copri]|uniref:hypothetical protein n=1 Tax=Segatella copri TaxID=165179 RepID=UPI0018859675|nr:hypothetical protein [Segatella copri]